MDHTEQLLNAMASWVQTSSEQTDFAATPELAAVRAAGLLRTLVSELADKELGHRIAAARRRRPCGHTWKQIGTELGVSGQAAGKYVRQRGLHVSRVVPGRKETARRKQHEKLVREAQSQAGQTWWGRPIRRTMDKDGTVEFRPARRSRTDTITAIWVRDGRIGVEVAREEGQRNVAAPRGERRGTPHRIDGGWIPGSAGRGAGHQDLRGEIPPALAGPRYRPAGR
ncbi:hypothetical protein [Crossiella sp. S99.2]|uniref:hypothetical protein n=1 Tax=Crossiella sp. S99.2 TaxID=2936272 RepID=UPI001FFE4ECA|nr:hypothetical protein [Crossiella sp. S99.2]MCK2238088.1 hypothetical protein [Crossiella sp. S99.2]